ncbi:peptidase C14 [Paenibacillus flagellatus]|uniref:Peptidase C14 n=1 Tax=Paenibacillus flagellatus TaxID=2211139 RepID=A0A2V5K733_9BACL|nr:peptidase C14 [Paenibacillus flagellatus]
MGDFRWFGLFGPAQPADAALDALVGDPSIRRVEAHSDLNFTKRHVFHRSDIEVDFLGHTVTTEGIERNTIDNPFGAVLFFQGTKTGVVQAVTLSANVEEYSDIFEVSDSSVFEIGSWWHAQIKNNPGGGAQRELDYLVKVTEVFDGTHVRFNYKSGWQLAAGRMVTYTKIEPAFRCHVRNMSFVGVPVPVNGTSTRPTPDWDMIGSNPVAFEYAVECDATGINATKVFWPVVMRRYNTHFLTERCQLMNPEERDWGGTGYLTQQINVLYGHVKDCNTSNARHLNDFTCAAYCMVENCHGDGDEYGPFVTHGQFEHDLTYIGNSGLLSFANSGTTWGDSAKRITVKKHIASRIVANKRLTDLTLEDCHAVVTYTKPGAKMANSGSIWVNMDGLQMRGCTAQEMITISKGSSRAKRRNIIDSCSFGMLNGYEIARPIRTGTTAVGYTPSNGELTIVNSEFTNVEDVNLGSINKLTLINTWFKGSSPTTGKVRVGTREIVMQGGGLINCGFVFTGAWDKTGDVNNAPNTPNQSITVDGGAVFSGTNGEKAFLKSTAAGNVIDWTFGDVTSVAADAETAHFHIENGSHKLRAYRSRFKGGKYVAANGGFGGANYLVLSSIIEEGVDRSSLPAEDVTIKHSEGNIVI